MDNKTKVKVAVVIGIVVLAVIFIFMVVFVKGNSNSKVNKNIPTKKPGVYVSPDEKDTTNSTSQPKDDDSDKEDNGGKTITLDNIVSLGIKENNLVKIDSDLKSTVVKELSEDYCDFCYGDNKAYIVNKNDSDDSCTICEIDLLKSTYPVKEILSTEEYGSINEIDYYAGKLYFLSERGQLVEYSIEEDYARILTNEGETSYYVIDKEKNALYVSYMPNGENCGIYVLDFTANTLAQIVSLDRLSGELVLDGNVLIIDAMEYGKLFAYSIDSSSVVEIGDRVLTGTRNSIAFYSDKILYTNGSKIDIKDNTGSSYQDSWYDLEDNSIAGISMISDTKLQIARTDENGSITRSIVIDLLSGSATEMQDTVYFDLVNIE